jgi:membrane-associated protease RseP (regulator of RpoE activity)
MDSVDILVFLASLLFMYVIITAGFLPNLAKVVIVIIEMVAISRFYAKRHFMQTELGMLLVRSRYFVTFIDRMGRKYASFFRLWADMMLFVSFGAIMLFLMKWRPPLHRAALYIFSMAFLFALMAVYPFGVSYAMTAMGNPPSADSSSSVVSASILVSGALLLLGFGGATIASLYVAAANVLYNFYAIFVLGQTISLKAGATLVLPGINLPFMEGIIAIAVLLVVHEMAHGFLSRAERVSINSTGIVLFGSLPVGAFVEPSDRELERAGPMVRSRILVAGSASNITFGFLFGLLYLAFFYFALNNYAYTCMASSVSSSGSFVLSESTAGCSESTILPFVVFQDPIIKFMMNVLGLTCGLNFAIGMINLLPIPLFDGYHLVRSFVKDARLMELVSYSALACFILLILPGLF